MPDYEKECFVVGAIGEEDSPERVHADWLLEEIIEPVFKENWTEMKVVRADRISTPGLIDAQIIDRLLNDRVVIADLTFLNPNAFYELGIRHVMQKPVIHVHRTDQKIPFDVSLFRSMKFSVAQPKHVRMAREGLSELLKAVLAKDYKVENPVTKARGRVEFEKSATSAERLLQDEVAALKQRLDTIEGRRINSGNTLTPLANVATPRDSITFFVDKDRSGGAKYILRFLSNHAKLLPPQVQIVRQTANSVEVGYEHGAMSSDNFLLLQQEAAVSGITIIPF